MDYQCIWLNVSHLRLHTWRYHLYESLGYYQVVAIPYSWFLWPCCKSDFKEGSLVQIGQGMLLSLSIYMCVCCRKLLIFIFIFNWQMFWFFVLFHWYQVNRHIWDQVKPYDGKTVSTDSYLSSLILFSQEYYISNYSLMVCLMFEITKYWNFKKPINQSLGFKSFCLSNLLQHI